MKTLPIALISMFMLVFPSKLLAEEIIGSRFSSGVWSGSAHTNNETGDFLDCNISASYSHNQTDLHFILNRNYTMTLGVIDRLNRFPNGTEAPVTIRVDSRQPFYGTAYFVSESAAFVNIPQMDAALDAMRRGNSLTIEGLYGNLSYGLNGTYRALDAAFKCASLYYNYKSAPKTVSANEVWKPNKDQERRMYQLSAALAADFGQIGIKYREDHPTMLVWDAPDKTMWVGTAIGRASVDDLNMAREFGNDMGNLSQWCNGDLATVHRDYDASGIPTAETTVLCTSGAGVTTFSSYIIRQVVEGELVEIVIFLDASSATKHKSLSSPNESISTAAAIISASFSK